MSSDEDVYEVEKIVDNVVVGGTIYYRVRWKNYNEEGDTWEPRKNLLSCEDLLNNYIRVQTEKSNGMSLPGDVFTAGTEEDTDSDTEKHAKTASKKQEWEKKQTGNYKSKKSKRIVHNDTSSSSDSTEEPQIKDDFYEKLAEGKIDVFANDMYSKVKKRRPPEKEADLASKEFPTELSGKGKKRGPKIKSEDNDSDEVQLPKADIERREKKASHKKKQKPASENKGDNVSLDERGESTDDAREERRDVDKDVAEKKGLKTNPVMKYLEDEIKFAKIKKKKKEKDEKYFLKKPSAKKDSSDDRKQSSVPLGDPVSERKKMSPKKTDSATKDEKKLRYDDAMRNVSSPNIVLQKMNISPKDDFGIKKAEEKEKTAEDDFKKRDIAKDAKKKNKRPKKPKDDEISDAEKGEDSEKFVSKGKKETKPVKEKTAFDAFSASLQEGDYAVSERFMRKKEKAKKPKGSPRIASPAQEKFSASPGVFEMLKEMECGNVSMTTASTPDPKVKDNVKTSSKVLPPAAESEKSDTASSCLPEMVEFLKIKVNFELDEISLKEIERHHEMGEPPCRLERDVNNAEFRQYIRQNNFEMVHEALKSKKAMYNLDHTDSVWMTQLMVAAAAGFDEIVKILAHHGARVNARTKIGQTALMFAAEKGHDIVCRILIAYGAYINLQTTSGETALMKAAKSGHTMIVRYLLQAGADPVAKSAHGVTALEIAERGHHHASLTGLIRDHEQNINAHVNECIHRECHGLGLKTIGLPILAARLYNIRETPLVHITFNCVLQNIPPNQGVMLFAVHGMIGSGLSIKCRMRGPCYVQAVTLNNFVMDPVMPKKQSEEETHFMTNLIWRHGQNSLRLFVSQDALCNEKLFVSIFQCGFLT